MQFSFLHIADVHLGYEQYGSEERFLDFGQAFLEAVKYGEENNVDFVLISGDLFNKRSVNPRTLLQATHALKALREMNIPVICVEGNHDRAHFSDEISWMNFLAREGFIILLNPEIRGGRIVISPWDENRTRGTYYEMENVRIYGIKYYGSSTEQVLREFINNFEPSGQFTILMMHTAIEGYMPGIAGVISYNTLSELKEKIDYVALGHVHKFYSMDNWVYNPGSLETWSIDEYGWKKGFMHVVVKDGRINAKLIKNRRRKFVRLGFNFEEGESYEKLESFLSENRVDGNPVVELTIEGSKDELDEARIKEIIEKIFNPIVVNLRFHDTAGKYDISVEDLEGDIEKTIIEELIRSKNILRSINQSPEFVLELKEVFTSSFDLRTLDKRVEQFLSNIQIGDTEPAVKSEPEREVERYEERDDEGEVWDWRRAYDKGS